MNLKYYQCIFVYLDWLYCRRGKNKVGFFYWMNLFKKFN